MPLSNKVRLRAMEPEDLDLIYRIENDPSFWQHGSTTVPYSRYALRQYLSTAQNDIFLDKQVRLVIETCTTPGGWQPAGLADLCNFDALHLRAEIGLAILPEFQNHGIGFAAIQQLETYACRLHLHQIYAIIAQNNGPATRLFERLAYSSSACLQDWLLQDNCFVDAIVFQKILTDRHGNRENPDGESLHHPESHR